MNRKSKLLEHLSNKGNIYELRVGNIIVEMDYSKDGDRFDKCMLNILRQKSKRAGI